jgi:hypothetical protein
VFAREAAEGISRGWRLTLDHRCNSIRVQAIER